MEEQAAAGTPLGSNPLGSYILHLENCISENPRGMRNRRNRLKACFQGCFEETISEGYERDEAKRNRARIPADRADEKDI